MTRVEKPKQIIRRSDKTLSGQVYGEVKLEIINCVLAPGQILLESEVARRYGVSKAPVREAMKRLMQEGLVQLIPGIGNRVTPITLKDVRDLFEMRRILETSAIRLAVESTTEEQLAQLEDLVGASQTLDTPESHLLWHAGNVEFHVHIAASSGNERLVRAVRTIMEEMSRLEHMNLGMRTDTASMVDEHRKIVEALRLRDEKLAVERAMRAIDQSLNLVQHSLDGSGGHSTVWSLTDPRPKPPTYAR